ncbi:MAG TPA: response regulator [Trichocoleus sp.]|jgi:DNA-binding response OmpR family regulator
MKILLVEDDVLLSVALIKVLEAHHYAIDLADNGQVGLDLATAVEYDLILLDVQVPKLDGITLCRQLRSQSYRQPIVLLTANNSDADMVAGFDAGADDYISKPCAPDVLLAKIRTWLRRSGALVHPKSTQDSTATLTWGELCLDLDSGRVTVGGLVVPLTATEYNLLELFLRNPDRIFSRSVILDRLWGLEDAPSDRAIVTYVKDVRKKLKAGGLNEEMIETVYGMGYRLKSAPQTPSPHANTSEKDDIRKQRSLEDRSAIDRVLKRFQGVFSDQVAVLEQAETALVAGNLQPDLQQAAKQESHKLAGSLASFGYAEGSKLARSIEHLLIDSLSFSLEAITRFSALVAGLKQELATAPIASTALPVSFAQPYRVLVIDDDVALTKRLKAESDAWGFRIKVASSLAEARSRLALKIPDVVLLDLSFPQAEEDGLTLLQEITGRFPDLPVIVFTGRDTLADRLAVSRLGARQFLHKPASTEQILSAIVRVSPKRQTVEAKVLIVDDDPTMLSLLSSMLAPWGIDVATLNNPQHFWKALVATSPNLLLLDLEMPQISGLELCQVVRQDAHWEDLPILVVTARTDPDSLQQAFAAGADDFIAKPVLGPELVTRVLSRIERTRLRQELGNIDGMIKGGN